MAVRLTLFFVAQSTNNPVALPFSTPQNTIDFIDAFIAVITTVTICVFTTTPINTITNNTNTATTNATTNNTNTTTTNTNTTTVIIMISNACGLLARS